ncbi:MAG: hypothetical protein Rpha_0688 [Candidatus Ruthia sp. Apha_13_S6]|nr:hypothetical protein [Candidatus Ruthia sp. Apha_13_S6]
MKIDLIIDLDKTDDYKTKITSTEFSHTFDLSNQPNGKPHT